MLDLDFHIWDYICVLNLMGAASIQPIAIYRRHLFLTSLQISKAQATSCREKSVLVAVYVERPRRSRTGLLPSANHHHHHHLHLHPANKHGGSSTGGNRRAELLNYSRRLRESAARSPHHQNKPLPSYVQQPINQIIAVQSKPKHARGGSSRMGNWKILIPRFLRSLTLSRGRKKKKRIRSTESTTATKAKAIMQSFQVRKKKGLVAKFLAVIQKYR